MQRMRFCALKELKETALYPMFFEQDEDEEPIYSELVCYDKDSLPFNSLQEQAAASITQKKITVLQGPPGTGKTQVIAAAALNAAAMGKSVLIASYNHQAINSVIERFDKVPYAKDLAVRANGPEIKDVSLSDSVSNLKIDGNFNIGELEQNIDEARQALAQLKGQCDRLDEDREIWAELQMYGRLKKILLEQNPQASSDFEFLDKCIKQLGAIDAQKLEGELKLQDSLRDKKGFKAPVRRFLSKKRLIALVCKKAEQDQIKSFVKSLAGSKETARACLDFLDLSLKHLQKEREHASDEEAGILAIKDRRAQIFKEEFSRVFESFAKAAVSKDPSEEEAWQYTARLRKYKYDGSDRNAFNEEILKDEAALQETREAAKIVFTHHPVWLCSVASARRFFPLVPGLFDLIIFDESSQFDFISALPLIFRAKSVAVVGDPAQLGPVVKSLSFQKQQYYLDRYFPDLPLERRLYLCNEIEYMGQIINSLYTFAARVPGAARLQILDSYRSCPEITNFISALSYYGDLKCRTDAGKLPLPSCLSGQRLKWEDTKDDISSRNSSRISLSEAQKVVEILKQIRSDKSFKGSVGVISPYKEQCKLIADCIRQDPQIKDLLAYSADEDEPKASGNDFFVTTVHKVQGSERDVIILSLCLTSSRGNSFAHNKNLLNVAVSRARSGLFVVGNIEAALSCFNDDLNMLLHACKADLQEYNYSYQNSSDRPDFESPLERLLYRHMVGLKLKPQIQHEIVTYNRRLDFALIDKEHNCYLDIEVDGSCHLDSLNRRKKDDYVRDAQMRSLNFNIIRFWGREVYHDPLACARKVKTVWEQMKSANK